MTSPVPLQSVYDRQPRSIAGSQSGSGQSDFYAGNSRLTAMSSQQSVNGRPAQSVASSSRGTRGIDSCNIPLHIEMGMRQRAAENEQRRHYQQYAQQQQYQHYGVQTTGYAAGFARPQSPGPLVYQPDFYYPYARPNSIAEQPTFKPGSMLAMMGEPGPRQPDRAVVRQSWPSYAHRAQLVVSSNGSLSNVDPRSATSSYRQSAPSIETVLDNAGGKSPQAASSVASTTKSHTSRRSLTSWISPLLRSGRVGNIPSRYRPKQQGPHPIDTAAGRDGRDSICPSPSPNTSSARKPGIKPALRQPQISPRPRAKKRVTFDDQISVRRSETSFATARSNLEGSINERRDYRALSNDSDSGNLSISNPDSCRGEDCLCHACFQTRHKRRMACARVEVRLQQISATCEGLCLDAKQHERVCLVQNRLVGLKSVLASMSQPQIYLSFETVVADEEAAFKSFMSGLQALEAVLESMSRVAKAKEGDEGLQEAKSVNMTRLVGLHALKGHGGQLFKRPQWRKRANSAPSTIGDGEKTSK